MLDYTAKIAFNILLISIIIISANADLAKCGYSPFSKKINTPTSKTPYQHIAFKYATSELWQFVRAGLNYLESPRPQDAPESVPPAYVHPDSKGYGAYGFSPWAYSDVQRCYPYFKQYTWQAILQSQSLYELANQAYADWLLSRLGDYVGARINYLEVFDILQKAWNLGLKGFKDGRTVVSSRLRRAREFKDNY